MVGVLQRVRSAAAAQGRNALKSTFSSVKIDETRSTQATSNLRVNNFFERRNNHSSVTSGSGAPTRNDTQMLSSTFRRQGTIGSMGPDPTANIFATFEIQRDDSPTSIEMKNSQLLEANKSFDLYFAEMRKRNLQRGLTTTFTGFTHKQGERTELSDVQVKMKLSSMQAAGSRNGNRLDSMESQVPQLRTLETNPTARDGHAAVVALNALFIFGGDRHHMPFNDLHVLPLTPHI